MSQDLSSYKANWNYPTAIRFGIGRIAELPDACRELGMTRPLLITDPGLVSLPITIRALELCAEAGLPVAVFSDVKPNPVGGNVDDGVRAYHGQNCDGVIAFGGGSALDVAKAVALMVGQKYPLWDFEDVGDNWTRVDEFAMAPVVAVPTTSGTGSEVGRASVIIDEQARKKKIIFHARMLPAKVICDPELTAGLPANLTAWVGMDALSHNLEAYCSPFFHPQAAGIAVEGIRLVQRSLVAAVRDGGDLAARADMMAASTMGAAAFQKGLGAMHAMAHPIGAVLDAQHGLTNAVVMPYVLVRNRPYLEEKMAALAGYMGLQGGFDAILSWVLELREAIGIPHTGEALGLTEALCAELAPMAAADGSGGTNPVILDAGGYEALYRACLRGDLG